LFADVLNDFAIFLEIVASYTEQYFRLIVCTAGVSKVCQFPLIRSIGVRMIFQLGEQKLNDFSVGEAKTDEKQ